jgi:hypothetical protein
MYFIPALTKLTALSEVRGQTVYMGRWPALRGQAQINSPLMLFCHVSSKLRDVEIIKSSASTCRWPQKLVSTRVSCEVCDHSVLLTVDVVTPQQASFRYRATRCPGSYLHRWAAVMVKSIVEDAVRLWNTTTVCQMREVGAGRGGAGRGGRYSLSQGTVPDDETMVFPTITSSLSSQP